MKKIDIVYTWVDGSDINWLNKKNRYKPEKEIHENFSTLNSRFRNSDEIIYSIRSIERYFPEHGDIYIVTDNQRHPLINENMVKYIDHSEILDVLPTFSSKKIESGIFKIKTLSEDFLYFNDDVFLAPQFNIDMFIKDKKYFVQLESDKNFHYMTNETLINSNNILSKYSDFDKIKNYSDRAFKHNPKLINKILFKNFCEEFKSAYEIVQAEVFRNKNAPSLLSDTYPRWLLYHELAIENNFNSMYIEVKNQDGEFNELIEKFNYLSCFCLNDIADNHLELNEKIDQIQKNLSILFPKKSKYEK